MNLLPLKSRKEGSVPVNSDSDLYQSMADIIFGYLKCFDTERVVISSEEEDNFRPEWQIVKRWRVEEVENEVQDAIDDEISKLARAFMRKSFLLPHPKHAVKEFDIGLWQLAQEYTQCRGKSLVRIYKCPMWS